MRGDGVSCCDEFDVGKEEVIVVQSVVVSRTQNAKASQNSFSAVSRGSYIPFSRHI